MHIAVKAICTAVLSALSNIYLMKTQRFNKLYVGVFLIRKFQMEQRAILARIETELTSNSTVRRRPFGVDCIHNIARAITYFYDNSHLTREYNDIQYLSKYLSDEFTDSKMNKWPVPIKYLVDNDRGQTLVKVHIWNHKLTIQNVKFDKIIRVSYVYRTQHKHEFHVRVVD